MSRGFWIKKPTFDSFCETLAGLAGVRHYWTWDHYLWHALPNVPANVPRAAAGVVVLLVIAAAFLLRGGARWKALALATVALLPPLAAAVYSLRATPIFLDKTFLPSTVVLPVLLAGPLAWARRRWTRRWPGRSSPRRRF